MERWWWRKMVVKRLPWSQDRSSCGIWQTREVSGVFPQTHWSISGGLFSFCLHQLFLCFLLHYICFPVLPTFLFLSHLWQAKNNESLILKDAFSSSWESNFLFLLLSHDWCLWCLCLAICFSTLLFSRLYFFSPSPHHFLWLFINVACLYEMFQD